MSEPRMPNEVEMDGFHRGADAYGRGTQKWANPFTPDDCRRDFWWLGWEHANHEPDAVHQDEDEP